MLLARDQIVLLLLYATGQGQFWPPHWSGTCISLWGQRRVECHEGHNYYQREQESIEKYLVNIESTVFDEKIAWQLSELLAY